LEKEVRDAWGKEKEGKEHMVVGEEDVAAAESL